MFELKKSPVWLFFFVKVPKREKDEVLAAFAAHKDEVTAGYRAVAKPG